MGNETTSGWGPKKMARLLAFGTATGPAEDSRHPDEVTQELLRDRLAERNRLRKAVAQEFLRYLVGVADSLPVILGRPLGEVLLDPETEVGVLDKIKDYGKGLPLGRKNGPEHAASIAIYYASIAGALVFHDRKITGHSYDSLEKSFAVLIEKQWLPPDLARLFSKARKLCGDKKGPDAQI
jgi:hypothetical protein